MLGAGATQVTALFANIFLRIFVIAALIAIPLAWLASYKWLEGFSYRTNISPVIFAASLIGLLTVTFLTVGYEIWRSVNANPVNSLRMD